MITIRNLTKQFANDTRITYQDLDFEAGQSYVLLGASGCGKTTLLNMMAGTVSPTSGSVTIHDMDMTAATQSEKDRFRIEKLGYIFQDFKLIEDMTVEDNLCVLKLERVDVSAMDEILDRLGILAQKRRRVRTLSGGEKQRVAIARAFVKRPDIILADEPTGNLNYEIGKRVVEQMLEVAAGKTVVAVTHDDRLAPYFDHVIDMNQVTHSQAISPEEREVTAHVFVRH